MERRGKKQRQMQEKRRRRNWLEGSWLELIGESAVLLVRLAVRAIRALLD